MTKTNKEIEDLQRADKVKNVRRILEWTGRKYGKKAALLSSFGAEDVVLIDVISDIAPYTQIFTLDTGRLSQTTFEVIEKTRRKYGTDITVFFPEASAVEEMVESYGPDLFLSSIELRKKCCQVRKVEPLKRALNGLSAWISGVRRDQSVTRESIKRTEVDNPHVGIIKINPLVDWSEEDVWNYIHENNVPYNRLHDEGYPSIGCAPCTRAIKPGEDVRAGRWWWEEPDNKECGLHRSKTINE